MRYRGRCQLEGDSWDLELCSGKTGAFYLPLIPRLRLALAGYLSQWFWRAVQQRLDDGLELILGNFGDVGHETIVASYHRRLI